MLLGYNTNGLPHHRWEDALALIAETGYRSVALTIDHHCLNPYVDGWREEAVRVAETLQKLNLRCVIETGARFLLNPRVKHEPTLLSATPEERAARVDFLKRCIDIAHLLNADAVSFWSGILHESISRESAMERLADGVREVIDYAQSSGGAQHAGLGGGAQSTMMLAFEPEPGMFIETIADFFELDDLLAASSAAAQSTKHQAPSTNFGLTIDIGHLHCVETEDISHYLHQCRDRIFNIHIEDMNRGVHEHLMFGDGEIDFPPVLATLEQIGYTGGVHVELSRHGHVGPTVLQESFDFLQRILEQLPTPAS